MRGGTRLALLEYLIVRRPQLASTVSRCCAALDSTAVAALVIAFLCLTTDLWSLNPVAGTLEAFFFALHVSVVALITGRLLELAHLASQPHQNRVPSAVMHLEAYPPRSSLPSTGSSAKKAA